MGADLGGCAKCSRYLLIVFNILFFLVGVALLAVGIWVQVQPYQVDILEILDNPLIKNSAHVLIALGSFIMAMSGIGFGGACANSKCMLIMHFIVVFIVFVAQLVACALVLAYKSDVDSFLTDTLITTMDDYNGENATDSTSTGWNAVQILFECCGTNGYADWQNTTWYDDNPTYQSYSQDYPLTCCVYPDKNDLLTGTDWPMPANISACLTSTSATYVNTGGCYESLQNYVIDHIYYIGAVGIALVVIEILVMIFNITLCRGIGKANEVV
ncbi:tetraspanin-18-like [Diadema antillarum]|uniref:tetraspanin-18-like n=1 Tax=Diadema antillarum TaxID=105358 RepID=UPI003A853D1A